MRFSHKKYPVLKMKENKKMILHKKFYSALLKADPRQLEVANMFKEWDWDEVEGYCFSKGIYRQLAKDTKLRDSLFEFIAELKDESGFFLNPLIRDGNTNNFYIYRIVVGDDGLVMVTMTGNEYDVIALTTTLVTVEDGVTSKGVIAEGLDIKGGEDNYHRQVTIMTLLQILFKNFTESETKILEGVGTSTKKAIINGQKHLNNTKCPVTIIDSRWYTEIIRTEGFRVRGHFRKQRYGKGMSKVKLKYIKPFKKNGYHRKAKQQLVESS